MASLNARPKNRIERSISSKPGIDFSSRMKLDRAIFEVLEPRQLYSTVSVNLSAVHQTVAGLGGDYAIGAITGPYTGGVAQDSVGELTLQYLSPTEARVGLPLAQWAPTNDNGQGSPTWSGYQDTGLVHNVFTLLQQLQAKKIQITLTTWNIPDWMCSNSSATQQREIASGMDQAYANAVASFVARAQTMYGVKISYFSVNEADGGYNVSLTSSQEASLITTVGAQFQSYGVGTKWLVGDTFDVADAVPYISAILQNPSVLPYVGGISYHTWWSDSLPASSYSAIAALGQQYDLPVFVTEVGVGPTNAPATSTWDFAADLTQMYYNILGPGEVNGAMDWEFQNDMPVASTDGTPYPVFYALQQMANTFTPGTEVVSATSDNSALLPLAAINPSTGAVSVQVQNTGSVDEQVTLTGLSTGTYTLVRTSATENESDDGTYSVGASGTITVTLPAGSISTFTTAKLWATGTTRGTTTSTVAVGTQLTGTPSASTTASYGNAGNTFANVFDGNTNTFFDAPDADGNWVQLDLGSAQTISQISYAPRVGYEIRMIGGIFEASNDPTFSTGVVTLGSINAAPADGLTAQAVSVSGAYRYVRYISPDGSYGDIAELQVFGAAGSTGTTTTSSGSTTSGSTSTGATTTGSSTTGGTTTGSTTTGATTTTGTTASGSTTTGTTTGTTTSGSTSTGSSTTSTTTTTPTQLQGTPSANTTGSWDNLGSTYASAFDGNTNTFFDAPTANGNWVQLDFGSAATITSISFAPRAHFESRMVGGIFEASNDPTFSTGVVSLYTISSTPADGLNTVTVSAGGAYRYLRYVAPSGSYGNIAEFDAYGTGATAKKNTPLSGTASASTTSSWNNLGNTYSNAFDGNTSTFFDAPTANGNWVQLDLGTAATITQITFAPRVGFEQRMIGGIFEASNDPTFSTGVFTLYTITTAPTDGLNVETIDTSGSYRYIRYVAPDGSYGNIAEFNVFGDESTATT